MRLCAITWLPARAKYVGLYCSVRNMQGPPNHPGLRKDVANMMAVLLDDWANGGRLPPSVQLADATIKLERKLAQLLRPPLAVAPFIDN